MSKLPLPDPDPVPADDPDVDEGAYDAPPELDEDERRPARGRGRGAETGDASDADDTDALPAGGRPAALKIAIGVGAVLAVAIGLLWYRNHHRSRVVAEGIAEAEQLLRLDTRAAFEAAFQKLEVPSREEYDPVVARSVRAFAAAMLHADYGDVRAGDDARALLVEAERSERMPEWARLARAALAMATDSRGDATMEVAEVGAANAWANTLQARLFVGADQLDAAVEPAAAAAGDGGFVPGLAVEGDVARRARGDAQAARASYVAALAPSREGATRAYGPSPRASFGLAKLALAGQVPPGDAVAALEALLAHDPPAPAPERARAALHLAALRLRAGDAAGASAALDRVPLSRPDRAWADRAARAAAAHRGPYRAVMGAPPALRSRVDDDPPVLPATPPPEPPPPPPPAPPPARTAKAPAKRAPAKPAAKKATAKKATTTRKATTRKPAAKKPAARTTAARP